ncbi:Ankyrin Repeat [Orbilia oligospora]|nr:Ankyrin Repeat [Orbilia oligospora]
MATTGKQLTHNDYTVGLIYVKPLEMNAIIPMLDERHEQLRLNEDDDNEYTLGKIGAHNVIVVGPPIGEQGKVAISTVVNQIRLSFKNVRVGLLVGIGGGVPKHDHDVRLGDVVVGAPEYGPAVVQYDLGELNKEAALSTPIYYFYLTSYTKMARTAYLMALLIRCHGKIVREMP